MKKKILALALIVLAITIMSAIPVQAITWGEEDTTNIYKNVGAIIYHHPIYGDDRLLCSGTLVYEGNADEDAVFLTAAHCTSYLETVDLATIHVSFDPLNPLNDDTWIQVVAVHTPNDYNPMTNRPDVGVLILESEVEGITPATLPGKGFLNDLLRARELRPKGSTGAYFTVAGYGGDLTWPPPAITYHDARYKASSQFQALLKTQLLLSQNNARTSEGGTCYGDSGGPVFWEPQGGESTLVAVTSWGDAMCVATGFYYRIDTAEALDFIYEYIQ
jgi:hypothetical protein